MSSASKIKNAASLDKLGELHDLLTKSHIKRLQQDMEDGVFTDAATLSAVAKFLADNNVFASPAENDDLADLRALASQRSAERKARRANGASIVELVKSDMEE